MEQNIGGEAMTFDELIVMILEYMAEQGMLDDILEKYDTDGGEDDV